MDLETVKEKGSPFVGQRIRAARRSAGLTLEELGRRIGISNQALSAIEKGKNNPSRQTLIGLARELREDFGEGWLGTHLREAKSLKVVEVSGPAGAGKYKFGTFKRIVEDVLEKNRGSYKEATVGRKMRAGMIPLVGEFGGGAFLFFEAKDYVVVPANILPADKNVIGITYVGEPMCDALVNTGDVLIISSPPESIGGEIVLLLVDGHLMIKRWVLKEDEASLASLDESFEPIEVPVNKVECLGYVAALLRFMGNNPYSTLHSALSDKL